MSYFVATVYCFLVSSLETMEYGYIENSMGLQEGYDPTSMYNVAFDSEFIHVSFLTLLLTVFLKFTVVLCCTISLYS